MRVASIPSMLYDSSEEGVCMCSSPEPDCESPGRKSPGPTVFECRFPGCGKQYVSPDGVRKHCRKHHFKWLKSLDAEHAQEGSGRRAELYCTKVTVGCGDRAGRSSGEYSCWAGPEADEHGRHAQKQALPLTLEPDASERRSRRASVGWVEPQDDELSRLSARPFLSSPWGGAPMPPIKRGASLADESAQPPFWEATMPPTEPELDDGVGLDLNHPPAEPVEMAPVASGSQVPTDSFLELIWA